VTDIWFISDTHFFHDNILKFVGSDGVRIRPEFSTVDEMNWAMVERWNSVVKPQDKVWHLGDVAFKTTAKAAELANLLRKLHGHKRMLVGNHDNLKSPALMNNFEKIELWKGFKDEGFTCSHIPLRLDSLRDGTVNVHGHTHQNRMKEPGYVNVCVEVRNYTPIHLDELTREVRKASTYLP
jgi:calcineurin-like phosphoesterase family protein